MNNIIIGPKNCENVVKSENNIVVGSGNTTNDFNNCVLIGNDLKASCDNHILMDFYRDLNDPHQNEAVKLIAEGVKMLAAHYKPGKEIL